MTHDDGEGSNVSLVIAAMKESDRYDSFGYITKKDTLDVKGLGSFIGILSFFFVKPYHMATAEVILMDNVFLPMAYLRIRKSVKVVQLWHGTGTIKKFGQDVNQGRLKELENRANQNITHLIVNSEDTKFLYSKSFGVRLDNIYPIGLPKTDALIRELQGVDGDQVLEYKRKLYERHGLNQDKGIILYAPTFRDHETGIPQVYEKLEEIVVGLPEHMYLGLRLHPFIAEKCAELKLPERVVQLSFERDVNQLILASDGLITDYSSIVFEYCLLRRPMVFFPYDLEEFSDYGRGFYYNYESFVPGPVWKDGMKVGAAFADMDFSLDEIDQFITRNYQYLDGKAIERLLSLLE